MLSSMNTTTRNALKVLAASGQRRHDEAQRLRLQTALVTEGASFLASQRENIAKASSPTIATSRLLLGLLEAVKGAPFLTEADRAVVSGAISKAHLLLRSAARK